MPRHRLTIAPKFFAVLAVVAPLIVAVALVGASGLGGMKRESDRIFKDNIHVNQVTSTLGLDLARANQITFELILTTDMRHRRALNGELDDAVIPVETGIASLRRLHARDDASERAPVEQIAAGWRQFLALRNTDILAASAPSPTRAASAHLVAQIEGIFDPLMQVSNRLAHVEAVHASQAHTRSESTYDTSRTLIFVFAAIALLVGAGSVLALIRNVVPRVKTYSDFAKRVAAGDLSRRLHPRGTDELAQLGATLNEMVERRAASAVHGTGQTEFADTLQVTESEEEAHQLLKRQLERSIADSAVVVLNRNNSADRLEATTQLQEDSPLTGPLAEAKPRSCLAVRFARTHQTIPEYDALLECEICGKTGQRATCEPLLVGGEVIGSVLVEHLEPLKEHEAHTIRESVGQSAPVLANLRNLAIAEVRAATDALTGLPNDRAVRDTIKRMVAQAARTVSPLAAVLLDLDHFKQINDTFGHGSGDDVLAAVGSVLQSTVRESDFVGRFGGEEFVCLLPATDAGGGALVAEKVRAAIAAIEIPGVERAITASFGVAALPEHAGDADTLIRNADRALYVAKNNGRNRVEVASSASRASDNGSLPAETDRAEPAQGAPAA